MELEGAFWRAPLFTFSWLFSVGHFGSSVSTRNGTGENQPAVQIATFCAEYFVDQRWCAQANFDVIRTGNNTLNHILQKLRPVATVAL
jgi:hypothetical protein